MAGTGRLNNVRELLESVFEDNIEGDFLEAGTWRGGTSIFARAVQVSRNQQRRHVYVCDSFSGLPQSSTFEDSDVWSRYVSLSLSLPLPLDHVEHRYLLELFVSKIIPRPFEQCTVWNFSV